MLVAVLLAPALDFCSALLVLAFAVDSSYSLFFSWLESDLHRMSQFTPFLKKEKGFLAKKA